MEGVRARERVLVCSHMRVSTCDVCVHCGAVDARGNVKVGNSMLNISRLRNCNLADMKYTENRRVRSMFEPQDLKVIYIH